MPLYSPQRHGTPTRHSKTGRLHYYWNALCTPSLIVARLRRTLGCPRRGALCAVVALLTMLVVLHLWWWSAAAEHGILDGRKLAIPYFSKSAAYEARAVYTAPLPSGNGDVVVEAGTHPSIAVKVQRRATRQRFLEEEINSHLQRVGVERDRPVRVRFHILSNFVDWKLCTAVGAAALAGFSIPITGFNATYSHIKRFDDYLDYVDREGLNDDDIVVTLDSDVFWTGADFVPFLKKFAQFSPATEAELDVAAVRAWEDYGEKKAPLYMEEVRRQSPRNAKRPLLQLPPVVYNADDLCWWGQHSAGFLRCPVAFATMEHMIEVARNGRSSYTKAALGNYVLQCADDVRREVAAAFPGRRSWMADDVFNGPSAASPYASQPQRSADDPLFYRGSTVTKANPISLLNGGMHVSRVWGLRHLASALATYVAEETPVAEAEDHHTDKWWCDQALFGQIYVRARMYEVEHQLLDGLLPSQRANPVVTDRRFGPPGLVGVDRRSEMVVLAPTIERNPSLFHDGGYLAREFPDSESVFVRNKTAFLIGHNWPTTENLKDLQVTRRGGLVTPPLLWRSATPEDRGRGLVNARELDADTVHVPFIHYAAPTKVPRFSAHRNYYAWLVAARHDRRARDAAATILSRELVELWFKGHRIYVEYLQMCEDPILLAEAESQAAETRNT